jgi:hypothetical protein
MNKGGGGGDVSSLGTQSNGPFNDTIKHKLDEASCVATGHMEYLKLNEIL